MSSFTPRQRSEIYSTLSAQVLALAPLTSTALGEVTDNLIFAIADQIRELYVETVNALSLLKLETTAGADLDSVASEYPSLKARFQSTRATGQVQVSDPNITKIFNLIGIGGSNNADAFLNLVDASTFPASGSVLIGTRGTIVFETFNYTSKSSNQLISSTDTINFDHGSSESVVLTTVGDRTFGGPFSLKTDATPQTGSKTYAGTSSLIIYDGEKTGSFDIQSNVVGPNGNTPSNTVKTFVGLIPFPLAIASNGSALTNGTATERDADLRSRIRQQRQALSTGNIDAVTSAILSASYLGQVVKFAQVVEDANRILPSIAYMDDGTGFTPSFETYTTAIILCDSALGGEKRFFIPSARLPIVTNSAENLAYVFSNITIKLNGSSLAQGELAGEYVVQPERGLIELISPLTPGDHLEITSIKYFTGLLQEVNYQLQGKREDRANYPGVISLGTWVQARVPAVQFVTVQGNFVLDSTRTPNDVATDVKNNIVQYINNLGIGNTVVRNKIVSLGFVRGVKDFTLSLPVTDVIIPDGTLAKATLGNVSVS